MEGVLGGVSGRTLNVRMESGESGSGRGGVSGRGDGGSSGAGDEAKLTGSINSIAGTSSLSELFGNRSSCSRYA